MFTLIENRFNDSLDKVPPFNLENPNRMNAYLKQNKNRII